MKLAKKVRQYQAVVLGSIVFLIAVSLVFWGPAFPVAREEEQPAGEFRDREGRLIEVSQREFQNARYKVVIWERVLRQGGWLDEKEIRRKTWEHIILLEDTKFYDIEVTDAQVIRWIRMLERVFRMPYDRLLMIAGASAKVFEESVREHLKVNELLRLLLESEFPTYAEIFERFLEDEKRAMIRYVSFGPKDVRGLLACVSQAAIEYALLTDRSEFKTPEKVQLDYLFADFETYKPQAPEPSIEEMQRYYEENKHLYEIKKDEEGSRQVPQYKPFEEVKDEIRDELKLKKAEDKVYELMQRVNLELGRVIKETPKTQRPDISVLAEQFGIRYWCTPFLDRSRIDELEEIIGLDSGIEDFAFFTADEGKFVKGIKKTTKGYIIYRLLRKKRPYEPCMSPEVRSVIFKRVKQEELKKLARKRTLDIVSEIQRSGWERAGRKYRLKWTICGYIDKRGRSDMRVGTEPSVPYELAEGAFKIDKLGGATQVDIEGESYIVVLEDMLRPSHKDFIERFEEIKRERIFEMRRGDVMEALRRFIVDDLGDYKDFLHPEDRKGGDRWGENRIPIEGEGD
jgi:hypothetical protein